MAFLPPAILVPAEGLAPSPLKRSAMDECADLLQARNFRSILGLDNGSIPAVQLMNSEQRLS